MVNYVVDNGSNYLVDGDDNYIVSGGAYREQILRGGAYVFRRISIKRRQLDGTFESSWYDISGYVQRYPVLTRGFGDISRVLDYNIVSFNLDLNNISRAFNNISDPSSLFFGYLTRRFFKIKIEVGYINDDNTELEGLVYYALNIGDPKNDSDGNITFTCADVLTIFNNYSVANVSSSSGTTVQIIDRIYDKQQNASEVFWKFFEGDSIDTSIATLTVSSPTLYDSQTAWEKIMLYLGYENFFCYVDNRGYFTVATKEATPDIKWFLNGAGCVTLNDYGINIIDIVELDGVKDFYPRVTIKDTDESEQTSSVSWTPDDGGEVDQYGERTLSQTWNELTGAEALQTAVKLRSSFDRIRRRFKVKTLFLPLNPKDYVVLNYGGSVATTDYIVDNAGNYLVDGAGNYIGRGDTISAMNYANINCKIGEINYDTEGLICNMLLIEI